MSKLFMSIYRDRHRLGSSCRRSPASGRSDGISGRMAFSFWPLRDFLYSGICSFSYVSNDSRRTDNGTDGQRTDDDDGMDDDGPEDETHGQTTDDDGGTNDGTDRGRQR